MPAQKRVNRGTDWQWNKAPLVLRPKRAPACGPGCLHTLPRWHSTPVASKSARVLATGRKCVCADAPRCLCHSLLSPRPSEAAVSSGAEDAQHSILTSFRLLATGNKQARGGLNPALAVWPLSPKPERGPDPL